MLELPVLPVEDVYLPGAPVTLQASNLFLFRGEMLVRGSHPYHGNLRALTPPQGIRPYEGMMVVDNLFIRPHFLEGVALGWWAP